MADGLFVDSLGVNVVHVVVVSAAESIGHVVQCGYVRVAISVESMHVDHGY